MKKIGRFLVALVIVLGITVLGSYGTETPQNRESKKIVLIASTGWTGSIAKAAGADEVRVLAPFELKHPPEYDFKPGDIGKLTARADEVSYLVWGGYEPFIPKLIEATGLDDGQIIKVVTTNVPLNLIQEVKKIAATIGRTDQAEVWAKEFQAFTEEIKAKAEEEGVNKVQVLAHVHQKAFVEWLGYDILNTYSGELSIAKVSELARLEPDLIIDNYHSPDGISIAEVAGVPRIELRNFPQKESDGLREILFTNIKALGIDLDNIKGMGL